MPKNFAEDKEKLKDKLDYLGLNLERIPKFLKEFIPFSFRPLKSYEDMAYKVYRYIPINDIQILLTPTDRLTELNEKYKLATPIMHYLNDQSEENIERFTTFLTMLNNTDIKEIEEIENEQKLMEDKIPYEVKYHNHYIWQIYYSDISNKYFMLVPTKEYNHPALFYLLKKQIQAHKTRKKEYIYAPVNHQDYTNDYLVKSQITDLENYLWYFTKQWPEIYEIANTKDKITIKIVGQAKVYGNIQTTYVITLENKEQAIEEYKLIKALFILATALPEDYTFHTKIDSEGELCFYTNENEQITYEYLIPFIQKEVEKAKLQVALKDKQILEEQKKAKKLKAVVEKKNAEYLSKQRQIATFLECKKTFFGKIKYYFSSRKKQLPVIEKPSNTEKRRRKYFTNRNITKSRSLHNRGLN